MGIDVHCKRDAGMVYSLTDNLRDDPLEIESSITLRTGLQEPMAVPYNNGSWTMEGAIMYLPNTNMP